MTNTLSSMNSLLPILAIAVCTFRCADNCVPCLKLRPHPWNGHLYGFSPVCLCMCSFKFCLDERGLLQMWHENGLRSPWIKSIWFSRLGWFLKVLLHSSKGQAIRVGFIYIQVGIFSGNKSTLFNV